MSAERRRGAEMAQRAHEAEEDSARLRARRLAVDPLAGVGTPEACPECAQMLIVGSWPFCKSPSNPGGHAPRTEVAYGWHFA
jgi:hypothetical protein